MSMGMLGVATYLLIGSSQVLQKQNKDIRESVAMERFTNLYYDRINSNINLYKITYDPTNFLDAVTPTEIENNLPLAWNANLMTDKDKCTNCKGRMGYVIVPVDDYRGLYRLTIRFTHTERIKGYKDYTFLITGN